MIGIPISENSQNSEELLIQNHNNNFSSNKLYICILIILFFIMTFTISNNKKVIKKVNEQIEEDFRNNLERYIKKKALLEPKVGLCVIGKKENK